MYQKTLKYPVNLSLMYPKILIVLKIQMNLFHLMSQMTLKFPEDLPLDLLSYRPNMSGCHPFPGFPEADF
jgi:hypothetical protein